MAVSNSFRASSDLPAQERREKNQIISFRILVNDNEAIALNLLLFRYIL